MGICKVCHTEQPEVFEENPVCWSCGINQLFKKIFSKPLPKTEKLNIETTASKDEVDLNF